jgi:uncharacterized membrane protein YgdD (TMEM256/DUF423 family)
MAGRVWIAVGGVLASIAVVAGAVGAHYLERVVELPAEQMKTYEVAVRYQMYHALGLVMLGLLIGRQRSRWLTAAGIVLVAGCLLFSGGIYAWLWSDQRVFIQVVPIGGTAWIVAWILIAIGAMTSKPRDGGE